MWPETSNQQVLPSLMQNMSKQRFKRRWFKGLELTASHDCPTTLTAHCSLSVREKKSGAPAGVPAASLGHFLHRPTKAAGFAWGFATKAISFAPGKQAGQATCDLRRLGARWWQAIATPKAVRLPSSLQPAYTPA